MRTDIDMFLFVYTCMYLCKLFQIAERALFQLKQLDGSSCGSWRIEEARLFWARKEHNTAQHLLKLLLDKLETQQEGSMEAARLYPRALGIYGDWLAETKSEDPSVIMEKYLNKVYSAATYEVYKRRKIDLHI